MAFMAAALPFIQAAGAAISFLGALKQGDAANDSAQYNAAVNQQNAGIARQNALDKSKQQERETYLRLGAIRAAQGKAGGAAGAGSVLDVIGDVAAQSELDRQNILYGGEMSARGYQNTANLDLAGGENAKQASYYKAGSELLSGASSTYNSYQRLQRVGGVSSGSPVGSGRFVE